MKICTIRRELLLWTFVVVKYPRKTLFANTPYEEALHNAKKVQLALREMLSDLVHTLIQTIQAQVWLRSLSSWRHLYRVTSWLRA
jgi:hypothetical protein